MKSFYQLRYMKTHLPPPHSLKPYSSEGFQAFATFNSFTPITFAKFVLSLGLFLVCLFPKTVSGQPPVNCNWTLQSEIDCKIDCTFRVTCNGVSTDYPVTFEAGCCDGQRSNTTVNLSGAACSCLGCTFEIILNPTKPERMYNVTIGGVNYKAICCDGVGAGFNCVKCRCGILTFNCATRTISILKSSSCLCQ